MNQHELIIPVLPCYKNEKKMKAEVIDCSALKLIPIRRDNSTP